LRGAGDVLAAQPKRYWSQDKRCNAFASDLLLKPGTDTQVPERPLASLSR
jgi:hypothetical protein